MEKYGNISDPFYGTFEEYEVKILYSWYLLKFTKISRLSKLFVVTIKNRSIKIPFYIFHPWQSLFQRDPLKTADKEVKHQFHKDNGHIFPLVWELFETRQFMSRNILGLIWQLPIFIRECLVSFLNVDSKSMHYFYFEYFSKV